MKKHKFSFPFLGKETPTPQDHLKFPRKVFCIDQGQYCWFLEAQNSFSASHGNSNLQAFKVCISCGATMLSGMNGETIQFHSHDVHSFSPILALHCQVQFLSHSAHTGKAPALHRHCKPCKARQTDENEIRLLENSNKAFMFLVQQKKTLQVSRKFSAVAAIKDFCSLMAGLSYVIPV